MRSTHSQNNSGRPLLAAELTVSTRNSARLAPGDVLQSRMGKKIMVAEFMRVKPREV